MNTQQICLYTHSWNPLIDLTEGVFNLCLKQNFSIHQMFLSIPKCAFVLFGLVSSNGHIFDAD